MYSLLDGVYDSFTELMYYFYFQYAIYVVLIVIMGLVFLKSLFHYNSMKKGIENFGLHPFDLIISVLIGIGFISGMMFQGVLADISTEQGSIWFPRVMALFIIYVLFFIANLVTIKRIENLKESRNSIS